MSVATYGKRTVGKSIYIPRSILTESVPGQIYEIHVKTAGIPDPEEAVETVTAELPKKVKGLKVLWARADEKNMIIQVQGSPFPWTLVLLYLPEILSAIGVAVTAIAVFLVAAHIPVWLWVMLAAGVGLIYLGPKIGAYIRSMVVGKAKEVWKVA